MNTKHDKLGRFTFKVVNFNHECKSADKLAKKLIRERNKEDADKTK